jgi:hypothetical protein
MRINILFGFADGPTGGGNQFLSFLKKEFLERGVYSELKKADCVIINSHHFGKFGSYLLQLILRCIANPRLVIIHRLDGLLSNGRGNPLFLQQDKQISFFSSNIANGIVYQSDWARKEFQQLFGTNLSKESSAIIYNSANDIFNVKGRRAFHAGEKIKLVYSSWSNNAKKGFGTLQYLDETLDFKKYDFYFVGKTPPGTEYKNIKVVKPLSSYELAIFYLGMHVFIAPMEDDACSNAVIEAVKSKLLLIVKDSGGNREIAGPNSILFTAEDQLGQILGNVDSIISHLNNLKLPAQYDSAGYYIEFANQLIAGTINTKKKRRVFYLLNLYTHFMLLKYGRQLQKKMFRF